MASSWSGHVWSLASDWKDDPLSFQGLLDLFTHPWGCSLATMRFITKINHTAGNKGNPDRTLGLYFKILRYLKRTFKSRPISVCLIPSCIRTNTARIIIIIIIIIKPYHKLPLADWGTVFVSSNTNTQAISNQPYADKTQPAAHVVGSEQDRWEAVNKNEQIFRSLGNQFYYYALTWQLVRLYMN